MHRHSIDSTRNILSAVRREHLRSGFSLPTPTSYFPLQEAVRGARRFLARPVRQKLPLCPFTMSHLLASTGWGSCWRCLYLTLWLTLARLLSLIPVGGHQGFDPKAHLTWSNIHFSRDSVLIILDRTKTIQCGERNLQFLIPRHHNPSVCLFTHLYAWRASTPRSDLNDPVFILTRAGLAVPLTRHLADPVYKACLASAGVRASSYGWSSFRRGGATASFLANRDIESLRAHGDWASSAYVRYLAIPAPARVQLVSTLQDTLSL